MGKWPRLREMVGEGETIVQARGVRYASPSPHLANQGGERLFSRKALVIICLRAQTPNAAAFRDWLASRIAGEVSNG